MTNDDPSRTILTAKHAAEFIGVSFATLGRMKRAGIGPPFVQLSNRRIGYRRPDLDYWLFQRTVRSGEDTDQR